eukprot:2768720-Ditylum_brightwellii.AAC.1
MHDCNITGIFPESRIATLETSFTKIYCGLEKKKCIILAVEELDCGSDDIGVVLTDKRRGCGGSGNGNEDEDDEKSGGCDVDFLEWLWEGNENKSGSDDDRASDYDDD